MSFVEWNETVKSIHDDKDMVVRIIDIETQMSEERESGWNACLKNRKLENRIKFEAVKKGFISSIKEGGTMPANIDVFVATIIDAFDSVEGL